MYLNENYHKMLKLIYWYQRKTLGSMEVYIVFYLINYEIWKSMSYDKKVMNCFDFFYDNFI